MTQMAAAKQLASSAFFAVDPSALEPPSQFSLPPSSAPDLFRPTRWRALIAAAVAVIAFVLPQEAPLAYYPLNNPSDGLLLLEITCAASATGETQISYDTGRGLNPLDSIRIPIAPSSQPYTYTFPLPDAPIVAMRLYPLNCPGELTITNFRIINRRGELNRRLAREDFEPRNEIAAVSATPGGWKLITTPAATESYSRIELHEPIVAKGMNVRNLQRCLLSWGYLALMLWILLLAVYFALRQGQESGVGSQNPGDGGKEAGNGVQGSGFGVQESRGGRQNTGVRSQETGAYSGPTSGEGGWRYGARSMLFLAGIALLFSAVGNRRLIKDAVRYACFQLPTPAPGLRLEIDLAANPTIAAQLFWDTGHGINETESRRRRYEPHPGAQTLSFDLPLGRPIRALRFDPFDAAGEIRVAGIRVVDSARHTRLRLPVSTLHANREIASIEVRNDQAAIRTTQGATDPILEFAPEAVSAVSQLMVQEGNRADGAKAR